jgi:hypothetical protein
LLRAWGVRAAGNQGKVTSQIQELIFKLANDLWPEVRLQVAIAAHKLEGIDPLPVLLTVQKSSFHDPLIARIVWQNLLPLIEDRQAELAMKIEERKGSFPGRSSGCWAARRRMPRSSPRCWLPHAMMLPP